MKKSSKYIGKNTFSQIYKKNKNHIGKILLYRKKKTKERGGREATKRKEKKKMNKLLRLILVVAAAMAAAAQGGPFTSTDLNEMPRVGTPVVSPDGKHFVTTVNTWDKAANKKTTNLVLGEVSSDSKARVICKKNYVVDTNPFWSPDGKAIFFLSNRAGQMNFWRIYTDSPDVEPVQMTDFPVDIETAKPVAGGNSVMFSASVYPDLTMEQTALKDDELKKWPVTRQKWTKTFVRRWDSWYEDKYNHVMYIMMETDGNGKWVIPNSYKDLMSGLEGDCPSRPFGDAGEYAGSPTEKAFAYTTQLGNDKAWSTDLNVYEVASSGEVTCISCGNNATDTSPVYSPDGKYIAYLAMAIPGYESDYKHIRIYDRSAKTIRHVADDWDVSIASLQWSEDGKYLYAEAADDARNKLYKVDVATGAVAEFAGAHTSSGFNVIKCTDDANKQCAVFSMSDFAHPAEIYMSTSTGAIVPLTALTEAALKGIEFTESIDFRFEGSNGDTVQAWVHKPYGWTEGGKYPVVVYIHGGPESAWEDTFHYRWNPQVIAAQGYVVYAPNPHGSSTFGSNFTKAILRDWGGKPYNDIMMGLDAVGKKFEWADTTNAGAMGASYGGYMINWINTQTDRFKCLVCHDGLFDTTANYWQTDELYFPYIEFGGLPTDNDTVYEKWSPSTYANRMNTPELIIHGGFDFRIPDVVGLSVFNNLQRRGVDSVFMRFPYETHFVTNPNNSIYWHTKIIAWLDKYLKADNSKKSL